MTDDKSASKSTDSIEKLIWIMAGVLFIAVIVGRMYGPAGKDVANPVERGGTEPSMPDGQRQVYVGQGVEPVQKSRTVTKDPRAKIRNEEGEIVPANPVIAKQMKEQELEFARRKERLRLSRDRFRAPPPPGLEDQIAAPAGGWAKQQHGGLDPETSPAETGQPDYVVAAFEEMRANGELDTMVDAQYEMMIEDYKAGYGEEGGPSLQEIEEIREKKRVVVQ